MRLIQISCYVKSESVFALLKYPDEYLDKIYQLEQVG